MSGAQTYLRKRICEYQTHHELTYIGKFRQISYPVAIAKQLRVTRGYTS